MNRYTFVLLLVGQLLFSIAAFSNHELPEDDVSRTLVEEGEMLKNVDPALVHFQAKNPDSRFSSKGGISLVYDGKEIASFPYKTLLNSRREKMAQILNLRLLSLKRVTAYLNQKTIQINKEKLRSILATSLYPSEGNFEHGCGFSRLTNSDVMSEEGTAYSLWSGYPSSKQNGFVVKRSEISMGMLSTLPTVKVDGIGALKIPGHNIDLGKDLLSKSQSDELLKIQPNCNDSYPKPFELVDGPVYIFPLFDYDSNVQRPLTGR